MSDLSNNIKKFIVEKIVDVIEIIILLVLLFYATSKAFAYNNIVGFAVMAAVLIGFYFASKYTSWAFEKWKTPDLGRNDKKRFMFVDTIYTLGLATLVSSLLWSYVNVYILLGIFAVMIGIKEYNKWKKYNEELCTDCGKPYSGPAGKVKEAEKNAGKKEDEKNDS